MSGELKDNLLDPVVYPNWMWVLGLAIVVGVIGWILYSVWRWWTSRIATLTATWMRVACTSPLLA